MPPDLLEPELPMLRTVTLVTLSLLLVSGALLLLAHLGEGSRVVSSWTALL